MNNATPWLIFVPFASGVMLAAIGMLRVLQRAGIEENGLAAKMSLTSAQRRAQQDKVFLALFDPKYPLDRWLVFGGFAICALIALGMMVTVNL